MRRFIALSAVAMLALTACGSDDSTDSAAVKSADSTATEAVASEEYCQDLTSFLQALDGIPGETSDDTATSVDQLNTSLKAMRKSNPDGLDVDYDAVESVTSDIIDLLADYDNDAAAVEADPDGAKRLAEIQEADGNMDGFMILGSYYENNCAPPVEGS